MIPEVANQITFKVIGNDLTIIFVAAVGQLQLNVMEPVIAISLNESIELLTHAIQSLDEIFSYENLASEVDAIQVDDVA